MHPSSGPAVNVWVLLLPRRLFAHSIHFGGTLFRRQDSVGVIIARHPSVNDPGTIGTVRDPSVSFQPFRRASCSTNSTSHLLCHSSNNLRLSGLAQMCGCLCAILNTADVGWRVLPGAEGTD
jgi:hypothetical protein